MSRWFALFVIAASLLVASCGYQYTVSSPSDCPRTYQGDEVGYLRQGDGYACVVKARGDGFIDVPVGERSGLPAWVGIALAAGATGGVIWWRSRQGTAPVPTVESKSPPKPKPATSSRMEQPEAAESQSQHPSYTFVSAYGGRTPIAVFAETVQAGLDLLLLGLRPSEHTGERILYAMNPDEFSEDITLNLTVLYSYLGTSHEVAAASAATWVEEHVHDGDRTAVLSSLLDEYEYILRTTYSGEEALDWLERKQQLEQAIEECRRHLNPDAVERDLVEEYRPQFSRATSAPAHPTDTAESETCPLCLRPLDGPGEPCHPCTKNPKSYRSEDPQGSI